MKIATSIRDAFKWFASQVCESFNAPLDNADAKGPGPRDDFKDLHQRLTYDAK